MPVQKIVVKVSIQCKECKRDVLKAVTKFQGSDQVSIDGEQGLLTILGTVDPVEVVKRIRKKTKRRADLVGVGLPDEPPPPPPPVPVPVPPKPDNFQNCCKECQLVGFAYGPLAGEGCIII